MIEHLRAAWDELIADDGAFAMDEIDLRGVPVRVYRSAPPNLRAVWEMASLHGDRPYVVYEDERYTYGEVAAAVRSLAASLQDRFAVGHGDRVMLAMRNYPEWIIGFWAITSLGAVAVGANAWWTGRELAYAVNDSRPKVVIADDERIARLLPQLGALATGGAEPPAVVAVRSTATLPLGATHWHDLVDPASAPDSLPDVAIDPDDDVTIFYTSGTTGVPKGAQLTHRGTVTNIFNVIFWTLVTASAERKGADAAAAGGGGGGGGGQVVNLVVTPLFHVTACNCVMQPSTMAGGRVVLMHRWDAGRALELIEREGVTNLSGVPTMPRELLAHPDWERRDTSSLRSLGGGGAPIQPDLVDKIDRAVGASVPLTGYGLTETHGLIAVNSSRWYTAKPSSCGPVMPTLDAKLVDELGDDLAAGPDTVGELCVRGSVVIKGYVNQPQATAEAITDGWFHTGDLARLDDDGFLYIVDRAKDMVLRGGENVYCAEVEAAIHSHDDVAEVAVFGVPDERLGETVAAVIVRAPGAALDVAALRGHLAPLIAAHKIPTMVQFRDEPLPRNANGKFLKRALRDEVVAQL